MRKSDNDNKEETILSLCPAQPGWAAWFRTPERVVFGLPITCYALVEETDLGERVRRVAPVVSDGAEGFSLADNDPGYIGTFPPGVVPRHEEDGDVFGEVVNYG